MHFVHIGYAYVQRHVCTLYLATRDWLNLGGGAGGGICDKLEFFCWRYEAKILTVLLLWSVSPGSEDRFLGCQPNQIQVSCAIFATNPCILYLILHNHGHNNFFFLFVHAHI